MPATYQMSGSFYTRIPSLKNKFLPPLVGFTVPEKEINTHTHKYLRHIFYIHLLCMSLHVYVAVCVCVSGCVCVNLP